MPDLYRPQASADGGSEPTPTPYLDPSHSFWSESDQVNQPDLTLLAKPLPFKFSDYIWISVLWLGISYLWGGVNGIILPSLNARFVDPNYKGTTLGIITALGMVIAIVVQPAAGALSDVSRHPWGRRRPFILFGGLLALLALIFMSVMVVFFGSWWMLLLCYLLLQFADNIAQGAYQGFIPDSVPRDKRGRASGVMGIAQIIGNVAGLVIATYFIDQNQPDIAILFICAVFTATLFPTLFLVKEKPLKAEVTSASRFQIILSVISELKHYPSFVVFIISRLFVLTALASITSFALYYLQDKFHLAEGDLTSSYSTLALIVVTFSLLSVFPAAWLSDRIGRKKLVIISCIIGAIGMLLLATADSILLVIVYGSFIGMATGSFNSIDWALATDLIPSGEAGRFMGVSNLAGAGSQALAALLGGALRDSGNAFGITYLHTPNLGYTVLFTFATGCFLLGVFFLRTVKEPARSK
jgi:MFS family permease